MARANGMGFKLYKAFICLCLALVINGAAGSAVWARPQVALALGGGAARGFSHIGLLQAFEEAGVPVDMLVGTSMGSVVAGLYAAGLSIDNLTYLVDHVELSTLFSPFFPPRGGLLDTSRFVTFLDHLTGGARFEDLRVPFYSVATNIDSGEDYPLHHGPLSRGIVASMSIPGMFPPVEIDGMHYVDGGMTSPVPAKAARDLGADIVIAVDVKKELDSADHEDLLTNLQLTLYFMIDANTQAQLEHADFVIAPKVAYDSYMDYNRADYFIRQGYESAKRAMPEIRRLLLARDPGFPFETVAPPPGIPEKRFRVVVEEALRAANRSHEGLSLSVRPGVAVQQGSRPQFQLAGRVAFDWPAGGRPMSASYDAERLLSERTLHIVGLDIGTCDTLCGSTFLRRGQGDSHWHPGVRARLKVGDIKEVEADLELGSRALPQWRVSLSAGIPATPGRVGSEYRLSAGQDRRGLYGDPTTTPFVDMARKWHFPVTRVDVWELAAASPSLFVGGRVRASFPESGPRLDWRVETGLRLELRLFGLYPVGSRLIFTYRGGDEPWSLAWVLE